MFEPHVRYQGRGRARTAGRAGQIDAPIQAIPAAAEEAIRAAAGESAAAEIAHAVAAVNAGEDTSESVKDP